MVEDLENNEPVLEALTFSATAGASAARARHGGIDESHKDWLKTFTPTWYARHGHEAMG